MTNLMRSGIAAAGAIALLTLSFAAGAQEKKSTTTPSTTPAATKAAPKPKSKCNAITEETACKADTTCVWIPASVDSKTGKQKRKAYCKTRSVPKKAKEAPKEPAKK